MTAYSLLATEYGGSHMGQFNCRLNIHYVTVPVARCAEARGTIASLQQTHWCHVIICLCMNFIIILYASTLITIKLQFG